LEQQAVYPQRLMVLLLANLQLPLITLFLLAGLVGAQVAAEVRAAEAAEVAIVAP
jgi:hypothetical protein